MKVITETMKIQGAEHVEYRRPGGLLPSTRTLRLVTSEDRLTWSDLMSDLDSGWLAWSLSVGNGSTSKNQREGKGRR